MLPSHVLLLLFFTHSAHAENWRLDVLVQHKQLSNFLELKHLNQTEKILTFTDDLKPEVNLGVTMCNICSRDCAFSELTTLSLTEQNHNVEKCTQEETCTGISSLCFHCCQEGIGTNLCTAVGPRSAVPSPLGREEMKK